MDHSDLTAASIHVIGYVQVGDPGAIGAGKVWIDTSGGAGAWVIKVRNTTDTGWESAGGHAAVTLSADLDANLLAIAGQELDLDTQLANIVFAGPAAGGAVKPTFRALVDADMPYELYAENGTPGTAPSATGNPSIALGSASVSSKYGQEALASGSFANAGDAQGSRMTARLAQANHGLNTWYTLTLDGAGDEPAISANTAWVFEVKLVGITQNAAQQWGYLINGLLERDNANNLTMAASNVTVLFESDANYECQAIAFTAFTYALGIEVRRTGGVDYNIRWVATIETVEVTYP